jgi:tRNA (cmo5U34)-methyltransferase
MTSREETILRHFDGEAPIYDELILKLIPRYPEMIDALVSALPFATEAEIHVLDLGCGTGSVAAAVLHRFPNACMTCLDAAESMLASARARLARFPNVAFVQTDFGDWRAGAEYNAVLSSLALHHLENDEDKRSFYRRVFHALSEGGLFYNADNVLGASDALDRMYVGKWMAYLDANVGEKEARDVWLPRYRAEDRPARLVDQLHWLEAIGFRDVDIVWKRFNFAVYGGAKRSGA